MKFTLTAILAATQLQLMGIDAATPTLCPTSVTIVDEEAVTQEMITNHTYAYEFCLVQHYRSKCLTDQFQQMVSETEFVKLYFTGNQPYTEDDKITPQPAHCVSMLSTLVEMNPNTDYSGQTAYNPLTGQYGGSGRRNRLLYQIEEFGISALNQEALQDFDDKCGNYEVSELFVYIQNLSSSALSISHNVCVCYRFSMN